MRMIRAKKLIEIGSSTGYSALCLANGLPDDGKLIALSTDNDLVDRGRSYWSNSGVS